MNEERLAEKAEVREQPFRSQTAVVGPLIARFRELWNTVATKWYVRPLLEQQNQFNHLVVEHLRKVGARLHDQDVRLVDQDREQTALTHDVAALAARVTQANRRLAALQERLAHLEAELEEE